MLLFINFLCFCMIFITKCYSFNKLYSIKTLSFNTKYKIKMISYDKEDPKNIMKDIYQTKESKLKDPLTKFTFEDIITPPNVDTRSVNLILITQGILIGLSIFIGNLFHINPLELPGSLSFDTSSMILATQLGLGLIAFGFIVDGLPYKNFQTIARDTRIFTLRVLGRGTSPLKAASVSLLLAAAAGFCEEFAFRGYMYTSFEQSFGTITAFIMSSLLFGLAHYPIFGSNTILEIIFGFVFAFGYYISGYNLAVPIAAHALYDFGTIYFTWFRSVEDFKRKITESEVLMLEYPRDTPLPGQIDMIAKQAFRLLDSDKDGSIDETEFLSGLHLFGIGTMPIKTTEIAEERKMFNELDKNKDGKISYDEFTSFFRDMMNRWLTMA